MTRIAVMGGGLIGRRHVERILAHPVATCAGLIDPDPNVAPDLDVPRPTSIAEAQADRVIIATPTPLHAQNTQDAAAHCAAILIEKPVAHTLAAADTLSRLPVPILIGHHRRHHPKVKALKSLLVSGRIGDPVTATTIWALRKPDSYFTQNWRSAADGSPVLINLVHDLDLLNLYFGPIQNIVALPGHPQRSAERTESGAVALVHDSGVTTTISFADTAASPWGFEAGTGENPNIGATGQDMLWITGTKGGVSFPSLTVWSGTEWSEPATASPPLEAEGPAPLDAQLDHFIDVINGAAAPLCSLADGRAALAAALEIETQLTERHAHARTA